MSRDEVILLAIGAFVALELIAAVLLAWSIAAGDKETR